MKSKYLWVIDAFIYWIFTTDHSLMIYKQGSIQQASKYMINVKILKDSDKGFKQHEEGGDMKSNREII